MSIFKDEIKRSVHAMRETVKLYTRELDDLDHRIEGHLICTTNHGKKNYYQCINKGDQYIRKSINSKPDILKALARKEFLKQSIAAFEVNIKWAERCLCHYQNEYLDDLKPKMHKAYQDLPPEYFLSSNMQGAAIYHYGDEYCKMRHAAWAKEPYEKSTYRPEGRRFPTSAGIWVRSKSEQHIVEQLANYGVPFRYEQVLRIDDFVFSADFTFRDRNYEQFYWEHAGMMNVWSYAESHKRKIRNYETAGIAPWKNLIITYDVDDTINVPMIKSIIENEVIPRL